MIIVDAEAACSYRAERMPPLGEMFEAELRHHGSEARGKPGCGERAMAPLRTAGTLETTQHRNPVASEPEEIVADPMRIERI